MLYMPGSNSRALEKARSLPADGLILDLEDAVAPDQKAIARRQITEALSRGGYGDREVLVRINGLDTEWGREDIAAIAKTAADGIVLPKTETPDMVRAVAAQVESAGAGRFAIWCMMETPGGILRAAEIAAASPAVGGLIMGTNDLAKELRCRQTPGRDAFLVSFGLCILAARAEGIAAIDAVHTDLTDDEGFAAACRQGRMLGFDGKSLIHPKTIAAANDAYSPAPDEIAWARKITAAFEAAPSGRAVIVVDGQMIEDLHVAEARALIAVADRIDRLATRAAENGQG
jgi:citrate lyase subunit beta/citryl-CoA lyase